MKLFRINTTFAHLKYVLPLRIVFSNIAYSFFLLSQTQGRESIAAKLVANIITEAGANRVLACDIHSGQSLGYFDIPVDHVYCEVNLFVVFCSFIFIFFIVGH